MEQLSVMNKKEFDKKLLNCQIKCNTKNLFLEVV